MRRPKQLGPNQWPYATECSSNMCVDTLKIPCAPLLQELRAMQVSILLYSNLHDNPLFIEKRVTFAWHRSITGTSARITKAFTGIWCICHRSICMPLRRPLSRPLSQAYKRGVLTLCPMLASVGEIMILVRLLLYSIGLDWRDSSLSSLSSL
jgi:hypothetical protein